MEEKPEWKLESMLETKIGSYSFSNATVVPDAWSLDGAGVGTVLNKKCPK
jgi:hypothetical protein